MREDPEFSAWLAARWPDLVRSLVFLGHPPAEAEQIALDALARLLPSFERLHHEDDVDVELYREALEERSSRRPTEEPDRPVVGVEVAPGLSEQAERREQVEAELAAMPPGDREATVLRYVAELSDQQVSAVLGGLGSAETDLRAEDVRFAAEAMPVSVVQPQDVRERLVARRRRARRRGAAVVAVLAVVLAALGWFAGRTDELDGVTPEANPLPVPWYADDTLHLEDVTVEMDDVEQLVAVPDGVVASDADGDVVMVDHEGLHQRIGSTVPGSPLVVEADNGWVAWADPGVGDPELVAFDTRANAEIARRSLAVPGAGDAQPVGDNRPIAIDDERVFYSADDTDFAWEPLMGDSAFAIAGSMVDTAGGARVNRGPDGLLVQPSPFRVGNPVPAVEGMLTRDGRYLFGRDDFSEMVVYDVATGEPIDRMYSPSDQAVSWGYVDDGSFLFVVLHKLLDKNYQELLQMPSEGNYRIYHCDPLRPEPCEKLTEVPEEVAEAPIIAR